jgi:hypothetical protein
MLLLQVLDFGNGQADTKEIPINTRIYEESMAMEIAKILCTKAYTDIYTYRVGKLRCFSKLPMDDMQPANLLKSWSTGGKVLELTRREPLPALIPATPTRKRKVMAHTAHGMRSDQATPSRQKLTPTIGLDKPAQASTSQAGIFANIEATSSQSPAQSSASGPSGVARGTSPTMPPFEIDDDEDL